jgi:hypothetical protein
MLSSAGLSAHSRVKEPVTSSAGETAPSDFSSSSASSLHPDQTDTTPTEDAVSTIDVKSMNAPDEIRTPDRTALAVVQLGGATIARMTLQPGWRWSECIKPLVGTESCQAAHLGYLVAGSLHVVSDDGTEVDLTPGAAYRIDPGHDAWVVGEEPVVGLEFESKTAETYARAE